MRRMYPILSFSFVLFLAVLCVDFLFTGLFVGLPESESGWLVIWSVTVAIVIFLLVIFCVHSMPMTVAVFVVFVLIFFCRVVQKNKEMTYNYENLPVNGEFYGCAVSYPQLLGGEKLNDKEFYFQMKITRMRAGSVFVPVRPFVVQVNCRNVSEEEVLCWGNYRVAGRLRVNKSVYFLSKNCIGRLNAKSIASVDKYIHPMLLVGKLRAKLLNHLKNCLSGQSYAFIAAIFFGNRTHIDTQMMESWRNSGLTHLLAVSGFHVGVLAMIVQCCLRRFLSRTVTNVFTAIVLVIFGFFLNVSASSLRAILMCFVLMVNGEIGINSGKLHSLAIAGIILLFINPYMIYDYGFILSFVAVAGILLFSSKIIPNKENVSTVFYNFLSANAVCIAAFGSTALFQCAWFGQIPIFSVFTSTFVCFVFSCVFIVLLACILLIVIFPDAIVLCMLIEKVCGFFLMIVKILEKVPPIKTENVPLYMGFVLLVGALVYFYIAVPMYWWFKRRIKVGKLKKLIKL